MQGNPNPKFREYPNQESEMGKLSEKPLSIRIPQKYMDIWEAMPKDGRVAWLRAIITKALES